MTTDTRTLENRFLGHVHALVNAAQGVRVFTKALTELPEHEAAAQSLSDALLGGISRDRLRAIAKASQGDSRRGRDTAGRLAQWVEDFRETPAPPDAAPEAAPSRPALRMTIKALREKADAESREIAKAHHDASTRTVHGQLIQVKSYETAVAASHNAGRIANALEAHPEHGRAKQAAEATRFANDATAETANPDQLGFDKDDPDHHAWAADRHDRAHTMHANIHKDLIGSSFPESRAAAQKHMSVANHHKALYEFHSGKARTSAPLNYDDNMKTASKKKVNPKTDMVD